MIKQNISPLKFSDNIRPILLSPSKLSFNTSMKYKNNDPNKLLAQTRSQGRSNRSKRQWLSPTSNKSPLKQQIKNIILQDAKKHGRKLTTDYSEKNNINKQLNNIKSFNTYNLSNHNQNINKNNNLVNVDNNNKHHKNLSNCDQLNINCQSILNKQNQNDKSNQTYEVYINTLRQSLNIKPDKQIPKYNNNINNLKTSMDNLFNRAKTVKSTKNVKQKQNQSQKKQEIVQKNQSVLNLIQPNFIINNPLPSINNNSQDNFFRRTITLNNQKQQQRGLQRKRSIKCMQAIKNKLTNPNQDNKILKIQQTKQSLIVYQNKNKKSYFRDQCSLQLAETDEMKKSNKSVKFYLNLQNQFNTKIRRDVVKEYQIGKFLGKGYFGEVYLAKHIPSGILCALKYLNIERVQKQKMVQSIKRQIECQILLNHPNICKIYQFFTDQEKGCLVLAIQFCQGEQLYNVIKRQRRCNQQYTAEIIHQLALSIQYMHKKNVIHRDLKPENIMISQGVVKLCDFGWAIITQSSRRTMCGTPLYSSPEIVLGKQYDKKIDLWAIGVLTYQMLVGMVPFKVYGQHQLNKIAQDQVQFPSYVDLTEKAKDFILRILSKDPQERMNIIEILQHPFLQRRKKIIQRNSVVYPQFIGLFL